MKIVAYCDQRYAAATRQAVGQAALTLICPPVFGADLAQYATDFAQAELIYFNLHAVPGGLAWITTEGQVAVTAEQLGSLDLCRAVIFLVNCYAGGAVLETLTAQQPRAIVGGTGENLGARDRLAGADLLGLWFRRGLQGGLAPRRALSMAKARLMIGAQTSSVKDALDFQMLYERGKRG